MTEKQYLYGEVNYTPLVKARVFSLKSMKKILTFHGIDADNTQDVFQESAKLKLITSAEVWFSYLDKRNITVYTYRKEILDSLFFSITEEFLKDLDYFLEKLAKEGSKYAPNEN